MARRRRNRGSRDSQTVKAIIIAAWLSGLVLALLISLVSNGKFNPTVFFIVSTILTVIFLGLFIVFSLPSVKGAMGEKGVENVLLKIAKTNGGFVFHNIMVEDKNGKTSQIDNIYVANQGIFVIEVKNYAGDIYGSEGDKNWTQVMAYGNVKNKFYNPVKQNYTHLCRLKEYLGIDTYLHSIVVFVKGNIEHIQSEHVYTLRDLRRIPEIFPPSALSEEDIKKYSRDIQYLIDHPSKTVKEHVKDINKNKICIDNGICPRCGGNLVERTSKDGRTFIGCSNFPKCRFTLDKE